MNASANIFLRMASVLQISKLALRIVANQLRVTDIGLKSINLPIAVPTSLTLFTYLKIRCTLILSFRLHIYKKKKHNNTGTGIKFVINYYVYMYVIVYMLYTSVEYNNNN